MRLAVPTDLEPMEARLVEALPREPGWQYEPKWDGFRCLVFRDGNEVELKAKSGKSLNRFFPDAVRTFAALPIKKLVLDGELLIAVDGSFSVDALQMRLHHAASRVAKLSAEQPATFVAFDCLIDARAKSLLNTPFEQRREALDAVFERTGETDHFTPTPYTRDLKKAERWLKGAQVQTDGVIAKRLDLAYEPGERAMLKVKRLRTADCVVGGFRYESGSKLVGSLLLGLYDKEGLLHHVGFTSAISAAQPLVDGAHHCVGAAEAEARRRGALRPRHRRPLSPRHQARPLAPGQGAASVHLRATDATGAGARLALLSRR